MIRARMSEHPFRVKFIAENQNDRPEIAWDSICKEPANQRCAGIVRDRVCRRVDVVAASGANIGAALGQLVMAAFLAA